MTYFLLNFIKVFIMIRPALILKPIPYLSLGIIQP